MSANSSLQTVYALIWKANEMDDAFDPSTFQERIPRLMIWLKELKVKNKLLACGGGGFENHSGGLTLITADSIEEAQELGAGSPMNEIGHTEILIWDLYYADLVDKTREGSLA